MEVIQVSPSNRPHEFSKPRMQKPALKFNLEQAQQAFSFDLEENSSQSYNIRKGPQKLTSSSCSTKFSINFTVLIPNFKALSPRHKSFCYIDFKKKDCNLEPNKINVKIKKIQDRESDENSALPIKSSTFTNLKPTSDFYDINENDKFRGNATTINIVPPSLISMKRAVSPLINSCQDNMDNKSPSKLEGSPLGINIPLLDLATHQSCPTQMDEKDLDKTPLFPHNFTEPQFVTNFEQAIEDQKTFIRSPKRHSTKRMTNSPSPMKSFLRLQYQESTHNLENSFPLQDKLEDNYKSYMSSFIYQKSNNDCQKSLSKTEIWKNKTWDLYNLQIHEQSFNYRDEKPTKDLKLNSLNFNKVENFPKSALITARSEIGLERVKSSNLAQNKRDNMQTKDFFKHLFSLTFFRKTKCSCDPYANQNETCSRALAWILKKYKQNEFDYLKNTYLKILSEDKLQDMNQILQIKKDINRTYPESKYFSQNSEGVNTLERILTAFAKYDPQIGYVQGMNFIAASLLFHAEEYIAFWLLVMIFEIFEMRDIYLPKLPGLSKHCQIIDILIFNYQHSIYTHLCQHGIKVQMFCSEWIFALFASVVPVENMASFYDKLLEEGWSFFYKIILALLQQFEKTLKEKRDFAEILTVLKSQNHITKLNLKVKDALSIDWDSLFNKARKMEIDSTFIYNMHSNFDVTNQLFRTNFVD